ncbi:hypothetical protein BWI96_11730 [Siphonobacter sp. SORGH_AS_0500]|uniref:hypothetical protein n=1 Tax=Siphonobacter sp. SORGH_AS_0500 TaxID=1864824 RepID=UPI000CC552C5|nr:hypothetical protein [Siphonobacter sp. SORGH_AS_0500]PKK36518.1 hypothetical protein BWI96_11730 [Siphonobacter sp. SORGH_AS_0500]
MCLSYSSLFAQERNLYAEAMNAYQQKKYVQASQLFGQLFTKQGYRLPSGQLYDGACIYALQGDHEQAFQLLNYLVTNRFYSNVDHLLSDTDLTTLRDNEPWTAIIQQARENKRTLPARTYGRIKSSLLKAKAILAADNGQLWGEPIWSNQILVLDTDNTIYSLEPLPESTTSDSVLYTKKVTPTQLSQSNSAQPYLGKQYAIVLTSYLSDSSATIIHELFHLLQFKHRMFLGNPVNYLDRYEARQLLRLEFQALRNALNAVRKQETPTLVVQYIEDALRYRKVRQQAYQNDLEGELQLETLEGMANYTGYKLSTYSDKYERAMRELTMREEASTYTRPFPYATGLAYGLLFDYLHLNWKEPLDHIYNFRALYERLTKRTISVDKQAFQRANRRNNYLSIHRQELARYQQNEANLAYYTNRFVHQPTLQATLVDTVFTRSFDMNGTLVLGNRGLVYSNLIGTNTTGRNFGNFHTLPAKEKLGVSGILGTPDGRTFIFSKPIQITDHQIIGEDYEIDLAEGWAVEKVNPKGDLRLYKKSL